MAISGLKEPSMSKTPSSSYLPADVLDLIAKRLDSPIDIRNFRAVCQTWRSSACLPATLLLPRKIKSPPIFTSTGVLNRQLEIIASNTYILEPLHSSDFPDHRPKPWIIRIEEFEPGKHRVLEPLTHHKPIELPQSFPNNLSLSRFKVVQVSTGYNFIQNRRSSCKLILYSPSEITASNLTDFNSTKALLLTHYGELYLGHIGNEIWNPIRAAAGVSQFDDIIRFQGCNYIVDRLGRLYSFTCVQWSQPCVIVSHPVNVYSLNVGPRKRLVEWEGELFLVRRDGNGIRVYKLNEFAHKWQKMNDLGGKLLFVATDCCFFASAENFPQWNKNTVIFHQESFLRGGDANLPYALGFHIGVYESRTNRCYKASSYRGDLDTFWPPPRWVRAAMRDVLLKNTEEKWKKGVGVCNGSHNRSLRIKAKEKMSNRPRWR